MVAEGGASLPGPNPPQPPVRPAAWYKKKGSPKIKRMRGEKFKNMTLNFVGRRPTQVLPPWAEGPRRRRPPEAPKAPEAVLF